MGDDSRLRVELGPRSYDILIGPGLIAEAGKHLQPLLAEPRLKLAELMALRYPVYAEADIAVDSADGPPDVTLERVIEALDSFLANGPERQRAAG